MYFSPPGFIGLSQESTQGTLSHRSSPETIVLPGKQGRAQRLIPGISSWETGVWAEESGGSEHRAGRPLGSLVMLRTRRRRGGCAGRREGQALNAAALASFCSPYGYIVCPRPSALPRLSPLCSRQMLVSLFIQTLGAHSGVTGTGNL